MATTSEFLEEIRRVFWGATGKPCPLVFGGRGASWLPIDGLDIVPQEPGVYVIGLRLGVQYERMNF